MGRSLKFYYAQEIGPIPKPVNEVLKVSNEIDVLVKLAPYVEEINNLGAHILVTIESNGERFHNEIKGISNNLLFVSFLLGSKFTL